ncbi:SDR family oxidoreductase [Marivita cryptomonadis]|uniref:SDR family oxidoreductase n=2 Tax=Roseobacteraceae TaxID=2854170 RepID=A0A9Q2NP95_9RHOB|nr:SDR family oxidoreductase [Marivita cryptomonadis]MBM2329597.1 SDR family oxidoreductase [Marivita cryptomonadis]MBM2339185.1 SDR family oxidoreductase [Marivita cryptomonadis]MBM2343843.1 SDR family oxidoreductase [Marivita cryptomonadis]MBM2348520.1 SDR family oxidoreductase [Marivita cryptomonadis]
MGATSGIGRSALDEAVRRGLPVRAFARSADSLDATDLVEPFKGDATSAEDVARALSGAQAVVYALGITERLAMLWEEETLFSETTRVLLEAMATSDVSRLVVVTGFGAGRSKTAMSWVERTGHRAILGKPYADKDRQEDLIMASATDWTIARPVILTKGARTDAYRALRDPKTWRNGLISRSSVAHYLIDAVEQGLDVKADVVLTR